MIAMSVHCTWLIRRSKYSWMYITAMIDSHFSYDLPDDLFEDGETKPTKPQKKKQSNKRTSTEVCTFFHA